VADLTLHSLAARRVFVCGDVQPGSAVAVASTEARKCYVDGHYPLVVADNGSQVTYAASWFGDGTYGPTRAADVWAWLEAALQQAWRDNGLRLLMTPATTGRDLLVRCAPAADEGGWPVMSAELQAIVRATAGQGRMETMPARGRQVAALYEYDARMAYVALLNELPSGEPEYYRDTLAREWAADHQYNEGRYHVSWRAPRGWAHPGILPAHGPEGIDGPSWVWPAEGEGWCSGAELFTAQRHGWNVSIREAHVWPHKVSPFRAWRDRLLRVLAQAEQLDAVSARMVRAAVRGLILHTIGSIHGTPHVTNEYGDQPPADAQAVRMLRDGRFAWQVTSPPAWPEMVHPEWSATIWGRARARLVESHRGQAGFVHVDPATLVAFRTDAVYLTAPTGWDEMDDGQTPGRYRLRVHQLGGAMTWPRNGTDLLRLRDLAVSS